MIKNILMFSGGLLLFLAGCLLYGILLNLNEQTLAEALTEKGINRLNTVTLVIRRNEYRLELYSDTLLIKSYRAVFGRNNRQKTSAGDRATPAGEYTVCSIDNRHLYHRYFRINYPNLKDAEEALRKNIITQRQFDDLKFQYYYGTCTPSGTPLGGPVGIHGIGRMNFVLKNLPFAFNWTDGSVALSDENIDELTPYITVGTKVVIR